MTAAGQMALRPRRGARRGSPRLDLAGAAFVLGLDKLAFVHEE